LESWLRHWTTHNHKPHASSPYVTPGQIIRTANKQFEISNSELHRRRRYFDRNKRGMHPNSSQSGKTSKFRGCLTLGSRRAKGPPGGRIESRLQRSAPLSDFEFQRPYAASSNPDAGTAAAGAARATGHT